MPTKEITKSNLTCTAKARLSIWLVACDGCSRRFENGRGQNHQRVFLDPQNSCYSWNCASGRHANKLVCAAVVKEPFFSALRHSFYEDHVWHLPDFLPLLVRPEYRLVAPVQDFARIVPVKHRNPRAVNELVIRSVINQHDTLRCKKRRRARLHDARIKFSRATRQYRHIELLSPVQQIGRTRYSHLIGLVGGRSEPIHP